MCYPGQLFTKINNGNIANSIGHERDDTSRSLTKRFYFGKYEERVKGENDAAVTNNWITVCTGVASDLTE